MASTRSAYRQVVWRRLASFRVLKFRVFAAHGDFWAGFDSRQLRWQIAGHSTKRLAVYFTKHSSPNSASAKE
jgi:hypothetical protein